jgi:hypothetical protein
MPTTSLTPVTKFPATVQIGGTVLFNFTLPSAFVSATISFLAQRRGGTGNGADLILKAMSVSANGVASLTLVSADITGKATGTYDWYIFSVLLGARYEMVCGEFELLSDPTISGRLVSPLATALAAINAYLSGDLSVQSYTIQGRTLTSINPTELLKIRSYLQGELRREQAAENIACGLDAKSNTVRVRFRGGL